MSITDDLKRLERAGSETGRMTEKLREAACASAKRISASVPDEALGAELPRGYRVHSHDYGQWGTYHYLYNPTGECIEGSGGYVGGDFDYHWPSIPTRQAVLDFARDISGGLLGEIAGWLEDRSAVEAEATAELEIID